MNNKIHVALDIYFSNKTKKQNKTKSNPNYIVAYSQPITPSITIKN